MKQGGWQMIMIRCSMTYHLGQAWEPTSGVIDVPLFSKPWLCLISGEWGRSTFSAVLDCSGE